MNKDEDVFGEVVPKEDLSLSEWLLLFKTAWDIQIGFRKPWLHRGDEKYRQIRALIEGKPKVNRGIKRYDIDNSNGKCGGEYECCDPTICESQDGEWVKWDAIRALIEGKPIEKSLMKLAEDLGVSYSVAKIISDHAKPTVSREFVEKWVKRIWPMPEMAERCEGEMEVIALIRELGHETSDD